MAANRLTVRDRRRTINLNIAAPGSSRQYGARIALAPNTHAIDLNTDAVYWGVFADLYPFFAARLPQRLHQIAWSNHAVFRIEQRAYYTAAFHVRRKHADLRRSQRTTLDSQLTVESCPLQEPFPFFCRICQIDCATLLIVDGLAGCVSKLVDKSRVQTTALDKQFRGLGRFVNLAARRQHSGCGPTCLAADLRLLVERYCRSALREPPCNGGADNTAADNRRFRHLPGHYSLDPAGTSCFVD